MPELIIQAREASISSNLSGKPILPFRRKRMVGSFIFMDHAGPLNSFTPEITSMDVLPHPHKDDNRSCVKNKIKFLNCAREFYKLPVHLASM
ncbi:MAG: hypothetical protein WAU24_09840 [Chitinophagaceae bacterium]